VIKWTLPLLSLLFLVSCKCPFSGSRDGITWVDWGEDPMANPEYMAKQQELGSPSEEHQRLAESVGTWSVKGKLFAAPGAPPVEYEGTAERKMILGGRYVSESFHCSIMGMPFEGLLVMGYDKLAGEYFSFWLDNMSTWAMTSTGTVDENGNEEMVGIGRDLITPEGRPIRSTITTNPDGTLTWHMYDSRPGVGEYVAMELVYTRT
jgi:hypothetical protein